MDDASGLDRETPEAEDAASLLAEEDLFLRLKEWFTASADHWDQWRVEAKEDFGFRSGDQWTSEEQKVLRDQMRPIVTFNRIDPVIDAVAGTEVGNRQEVSYIPRTEGDVQVNEVYTSAAKWFREQCDAEDEESDAFQDVLTCGVGWTETRLDYEQDEEGAPLVDRVDPFEMFPDHTSNKRNFEDARYVFRVRTNIGVDEAMALVPNADPSELDASWALTGDTKSDGESQEQARFYRSDGKPMDQSEKGKVTLVEVQWWERKSVHFVADHSRGQIVPMEDSSFKIYSQRITELGGEVKHVTMTKRVYYRAFLGKKVLIKEASPFQGHFSYKAITGKRDRNKRTYYGLVRQMKDPQRWANKWLSQTMHIMNSNAKGGIIAEEGIAENMVEFEKTYARPEAVTKVKNGSLSGQNPKFVPKPSAEFPGGFFQLMQFAISSVRDASGVNLELLGMADREQAGVLEATRKKAAMAILATLFDSLRRYRKSQGRLLLQIINDHLSDGRLVRIVGEEGAKYVPLTNAQGAQKFDVIVDDAPSSPHQREMTWQMLMQLLPAVKDGLSPDMWAEIVALSPLPSAVAEKFRKALLANAENAAKSGAEKEEIGKADAISKIEETQSKTALNMSKVQSEGVKAQADLIQAMTPNPQPRFPQ